MQARNANRSQASVQTRHSRAPSVALEPIPETPTTPSYTRPTAPTTADKAENSWISTRKFSVSSTSSHMTASKRRSEYDEGCPRTPKAAKHELDVSSTHSKKSKFSIPFMKSVSYAFYAPPGRGCLSFCTRTSPSVAGIVSPLMRYANATPVKCQYLSNFSTLVRFAEPVCGPCLLSVPRHICGIRSRTTGPTGGTAGSLYRSSSLFSHARGIRTGAGYSQAGSAYLI